MAQGLHTVVPSTLRARVLAIVHEGHLGVEKTKQHCRSSVWWSGVDRDVEVMVKDCTACLTSGKTGLPPPPPPQPLTWPPAPWTHIQMDICGKLHNVPQRQRFLLVAPRFKMCFPPAPSPPRWSLTSSHLCLLAGAFPTPSPPTMGPVHLGRLRFLRGGQRNQTCQDCFVPSPS